MANESENRPGEAKKPQPEQGKPEQGKPEQGTPAPPPAAQRPQPPGDRRQAVIPEAGKARTAGNSRDLAREDTVIGPVSPTRARAIRLGREAAARSGAPKLPTAAELDRIRDEHFGGNPGTVRVDAPPQGSGPDAPATRLIFFDADGRKAGEREYTGPDDQE